MKKFIFIFCLIILAGSGNIATAVDALCPMKPIFLKFVASESFILFLIGSLFLIVAGFSKKSYK